jgi:hypothetical protein
MSRFARVDSIDAIESLRTTLCKVAEMVENGLGEAEVEIQRVGVWLHGQAVTHWKAELRKRSELMQRAKLVLERKRNEKTPTGGRYSCVDEKTAFEAARRRYEEADAKLKNVQRWSRQIEEEEFNFRGLVKGLHETLDVQVPRAVTRLDAMRASLEDYVAVRGATDEGSAPRTADGESMARGRAAQAEAAAPDDEADRFRALAPDRATRDGLTVQVLEVPTLQPAALAAAGQDGVAALASDASAPGPSEKVVLAWGAWNRNDCFFVRSPGAKFGDSGWYVGFADRAEEEGLVATRLADVLAIRPDWRAVLRLAVGSVVVAGGQRIERVWDAANRVVWAPEAAG